MPLHTPAHLLLVLANHPLHPQKRTRLLHVIANQCAHWCGNPFSPQRSLASWHYFGQIRGTLSRIRLRHCPPSCPTAGVTDCHVASLLAMTGKNLLRVRTARTHLGRNVVHFTRARRCASLPGLWMSLRTSALKWCGNPHPWQKRRALQPCTGARTPTRPVIANQCAHWCGNPFLLRQHIAESNT